MKTSIVILTHNKWEYTQGCIESIRQYTEQGTYEIIVVDNASTDRTQEWLADQSDIICIFNDHNVGFPKGCNQGIGVASGDNILLLNNDVIVTTGWLENMLKALYSSESIGAVGPITNNAVYYQNMEVNYSSLEEMQEFARDYNNHDPNKWEMRLKLVGFCMLIKGTAVQSVGLLDEQFTPGNFEDDDYSFRLLEAGYKLLFCKDTFVHHFGHTTFKDNPSGYREIMKQNQNKFNEKWGFDSLYSSYIRSDVVEMMDAHPADQTIRVLEIGCACGGTLLKIKNQYKNAELYGIELNPHSAEIAALFAQVSASNVEHDLDYPEKFFDYIIFPDVLEHLNDPWSVLRSMKRYLKPRGKVLASIPNVMHYTVLKDLISGRWTYTDAGLLDRTHLRFFTLAEIQLMFEATGYHNMKYNARVTTPNESEQDWISKLTALGGPEFEAQYKVYQYLVKAENSNILESVKKIVDELGSDAGNGETVSELVSLLINDDIGYQDISEAIDTSTVNKQTVCNQLAIAFYKSGYHDLIIPLLQKSLSINSKDRDTLFNLGYILHLAHENELALFYLDQIAIQDDDTAQLIEQIRQLSH